MNETQELWREESNKQRKIIEKLEELLQTAKDLDISISNDLIEKLKTLKEETDERKLRIVLAGGFSEGKTSIVAAWLGKLDKSTMKISQQESSDEIVVYDVDENMKIVDTPGLFGFKEKENGEKYKDITKKYISESDILLYIMNPNNPIKEGHKQELITLFDKIDLLSRTIFVLAQFDKEADLEIEEDYKERLAIKIDNIKSRLKDFLKLKDETLNKITIVAVSADPNEKGIEYWLENNEVYKKLSHIENLQRETTNIIKQNGGYLEVIKQTEKSIIKDILNNILPKSEEIFKNVSFECSKMKTMCEKLKEELKIIKQNIADAKKELRNNITNLFTDLILQNNGLTLETYKEFFEKNIGDKGVVLETNIRNMFDDYINSADVKISKLKDKYTQETNHFLDICEQFNVKGMLNTVGDLVKTIDNQMILNVRNVFDLPIKFKPWGALKLADNISKWVRFGFGSMGNFG